MQVNTAARLLRVGYQEYLHPLTLSPLRDTPEVVSVLVRLQYASPKCNYD